MFKKSLILLVLGVLLLSSCVEAGSLWGQYQTPTPYGWVSASPLPEETITSAVSDTLIPTWTPFFTPTAISNFVTKDPNIPTVEVTSSSTDDGNVLYYAQPGDWLPAVAKRFGVDGVEITSPKQLSGYGFIDAGTLLIIPDDLDKSIALSPATQFMPDAEVVYSSTSSTFNVEEYVSDAGGYLSSYREYLGTTAWTSGAREIDRIAYENSISPRLLLAILDYEANWVRGQPEEQLKIDYPLGNENFRNKGLFGQLAWAINQIHEGYYGWRTGELTGLVFSDGKAIRLDPNLNAGTVGIMNFFSRKHTLNEWLRIMDVNGGFPSFYQNMFGDPWSRTDAMGSFFPPNLKQPPLVLPIQAGSTWAFTGGPHGAWESGVPLAAIDFAPESERPGCFASKAWVVAIGSGLVVRSSNGVVVLDMDGDGSEQTGWNIMYLHIAAQDRVPLGQWVEQNGLIGHASCEGGVSTGTHVHIARKYNGEWMLADGPIPFQMGDWTVIGSTAPYLGKLVNGNRVVTADVYGQAWSLITREEDE